MPTSPNPKRPRRRAALEVKFLDFWRRHPLQGGTLLVACSGGIDSLTLVELCARHRAALDGQVRVVTIDHGLRAASAAECERVVAFANGRDLPVEIVRLGLANASLAEARTARYAALLGVARTHGAAMVAVAHHANDQLETLLDHLVRGSGLRGLAAMADSRPLDHDVVLVRPLLAVGRDAIAAWATAQALAPVDDPSNRDRRRLRSRLRHEVVPLLVRERPNLVEAIAELCARLGRDAALLDELARLPDPGDRVRLAALPRPLFARALVQLVGTPLSSEQERQAFALCGRGDGTATLALGDGRLLVRSYDRVYVATPTAPSTALPTLTGAGTYTVGSAELVIDAALWQRVADGAPRLRRPARGDRMVWRGHHRKLSDLFINGKVPRPARAEAVVLEAHGAIAALFLLGERGPTLPAVLLATPP